MPAPFEENVPTYTAVDKPGIDLQIDGLAENEAELGLPLTRFPGISDHGSFVPAARARSGDGRYPVKAGIVRTLFQAVGAKNGELVAAMVRRGLVSPDCRGEQGETPLIAAADAGNAAMVRLLVGLGAVVDGFGMWERTRRTALQVAAARGNLTVVRLLVEECGADDALLAPDGQMALRLAVDRGHREVVDYLPLRRGGAWRRWKAHHAVAMRRVRRASRGIYVFFKYLLWYTPKFLFYSVPKDCVVLPARDAGRWAWKNRCKVGPWCQGQIKAMPHRAGRAGKAIWEETKKMPGRVKAAVLWMWRCVRRIPAVLRIVGEWIGSWLKRVGSAVANAFLRVVALVHTALSAIVSFFRRITLRDVWNAICGVLRAVFIELPRAIWSAAEAFGGMSYRAMKAMFGFCGQSLWWIGLALLIVVTYVPKQIGVIFLWMGSLATKAAQEVLVWINPKR
ncbi:hypothetical protein SLS57_001226 [Botryosphaeria dothidea]